MSDTISKWYEDKQNVAEMVQWNKGKLKKWEKLVADHLPKGAAILDIGCGMGREAFALSDLGFSVVGIDISQEAITQVTELAGEAGYHIPFLHYDGHTLPFEDESFY
ncbi:MAG: class I SAM-dependent methyltransferase, partial [Limnochordia bacterium]